MTTPRGVQSRCKRMGLPPFLFYLVLSIHEAPGSRPRLETAALYGSRLLAQLRYLTLDHEVNFVRRDCEWENRRGKPVDARVAVTTKFLFF